ncbi:MAG: anti-sigma regulatory factor [Gemmatimonadota bacterium]|nr:anti-sigma regulatory factor [Gemmatimonadota bacterium]
MESVIATSTSAPGVSTRLDIDESSQIGDARRYASALGLAQGLDSDAIGRLAILVTEAATNILRHGHGGMLVLRSLLHSDAAVIEVLALDKGPGIPNIDRAMADGYSSGGTAGQGLGAIRRLSEVFAIHSQRGLGTAILARVSQRAHASSRAVRTPTLDDRLGVVCVPMRGEVECGDHWEVVASRERLTVMLVDGLGHGPEAAVAAASATRTFRAQADRSHEAIFSALDAGMHGTRGAALSVVTVEAPPAAVTFTGVGNVDARLTGGRATQYLVPQNGIVGHGMPPLRSTRASWSPGGHLVMHSDGIPARWRMDAYQGVPAHPGLLAGMIYRDFARERDDVTVVVLGEGVARELA